VSETANAEEFRDSRSVVVELDDREEFDVEIEKACTHPRDKEIFGAWLAGVETQEETGRRLGIHLSVVQRAVVRIRTALPFDLPDSRADRLAAQSSGDDWLGTEAMAEVDREIAARLVRLESETAERKAA
jgi:hypothetical protein